jgi:hypothetical protein
MLLLINKIIFQFYIFFGALYILKGFKKLVTVFYMKKIEKIKINVSLKKWCVDSQFVNHKLQIF